MIKDSSHPIPEEMYDGFEAHGVEIVIEVLTIPVIDFSYDCIILHFLDNHSIIVE